MKVRIKKKNMDGIVRLESSSELKEIVIKEDFLKPKNTSIELCFKGRESSGIVDLGIRELEIINREVEKKKHIFGDVKIMKFDK